MFSEFGGATAAQPVAAAGGLVSYCLSCCLARNLNLNRNLNHLPVLNLHPARAFALASAMSFGAGEGVG